MWSISVQKAERYKIKFLHDEREISLNRVGLQALLWFANAWLH